MLLGIVASSPLSTSGHGVRALSLPVVLPLKEKLAVAEVSRGRRCGTPLLFLARRVVAPLVSPEPAPA